MAEWLIEEGIGEERAVLLDNGEVVAARLRWPGELEAGLVARARLIMRRAGSPRGVVSFASGQHALVTRLPRDASEGAQIMCEIVRPAMSETGRHKLAQARVSTAAARTAPSLLARLQDEGFAARQVHRIPPPFWGEAIANAQAAGWGFAGGSISLFPTPAMTLIDVDGELPPRDLALAAAGAVAQAVRWLDLGGNIGVDFPTLQAKQDRRAVDEALALALADWPHERTAMNGFGFVQIVARLQRPSLLHRAQFERAGMAARYLLRCAEHLDGTGRAIELCAHPAVLAAIGDGWREELARRTGRRIVERSDPALALEAPHAQFIAS